MIAKEELLRLKTKILPDGAENTLDFLAAYHNQVELTNIVLENVPLLIIGRHGMIARIYDSGRIMKASQPKEIFELLQNFLKGSEKLYVFINLPDLPIPDEVTEVLREVEERALRKEELQQRIDEALDNRNREMFIKASNELKKLDGWDLINTSPGRHTGFN